MIDSGHTERVAKALEAIAIEKKEQTQILADINSNLLQLIVDLNQRSNMDKFTKEEIVGFLDGVKECRRAGLM